MSWFRYWVRMLRYMPQLLYPWMYFLPQPIRPEDELMMLENYKKRLEEELKDLREEIKRVEKRINELKNMIERAKPESEFEIPPIMPSYGPAHGGAWRGRGTWSPSPYGTRMPEPLAVKRGMLKVAAPVENRAGLKSIISQVAARAPYIALVDIVDGSVKNIKVLENPASISRGGAGYMLAQWLKENNVNVFLASNVGSNLAQGLATSGISVLQVISGRTLEDSLRMLKLLR